MLSHGDRVAVLDVETTGLYRSDRVVEIAVVTMDASGQVIDEFDTLINPGRDVGPTWLHRITASMVSDAPSFAEVAAYVAARVDGAVCVGHNLRFDTGMLGTELERAGIEIDWGTGFDTLSVTGCKLGQACTDYGVRLDNAHRALSDARATARLLVAVADRFGHVSSPARAYPLDVTPVRVRSRDGHPAVHAPTPYLAQLARGFHVQPDIAPYVGLLDVAMADLKLTLEERGELHRLANDIGLDDLHIVRAHREFLRALIDAAVADGVVTDDEIDQLRRAAALLDLDSEIVTQRTDPYRSTPDRIALKPGLEVCFTGAAVDSQGNEIDRDDLHVRAERHGLVPKRSVTAKGCQLLVAADVSTRSGKSDNAKKFGIPIAALDDFLRVLPAGGSLDVVKFKKSGVALVCAQCGDSWVAARRSSQPRCAGCR
ncbi:exonuclease domain-containing protein [Nocardia sp. N2S4-5]|uniref:exonuclease domain-containing protein n=1 Tax=Nocardia sp. N2S4-5 TaxID=3351565 RepID=UPI0037CF7B6F